MTSNNWLALLILSILGVTAYMVATRPDPTDNGWGDIDEDW